MVVLPVGSSNAQYRKVNERIAREEGYETDCEYYEPNGDYYFFFTDSEMKAKELVENHRKRWS